MIAVAVAAVAAANSQKSRPQQGTALLILPVDRLVLLCHFFLLSRCCLPSLRFLNSLAQRWVRMEQKNGPLLRFDLAEILIG